MAARALQVVTNKLDIWAAKSGNNEDQNYQEIERSIKRTEVYLRRLEYGRTDEDRRDEPDTTTLVVVK